MVSGCEKFGFSFFYSISAHLREQVKLWNFSAGNCPCLDWDGGREYQAPPHFFRAIMNRFVTCFQYSHPFHCSFSSPTFWIRPLVHRSLFFELPVFLVCSRIFYITPSIAKLGKVLLSHLDIVTGIWFRLYAGSIITEMYYGDVQTSIFSFFNLLIFFLSFCWVPRFVLNGCDVLKRCSVLWQLTS